MLMLAVFCLPQAQAQSGLTDTQGKCGSDLKWKFDGNTLSFENINKQGWSTEIPDFVFQTITVSEAGHIYELEEQFEVIINV